MNETNNIELDNYKNSNCFHRLIGKYINSTLYIHMIFIYILLHLNKKITRDIYIFMKINEYDAKPKRSSHVRIPKHD